MRERFEVRAWDGAGRVGDLEVPRAGASVETPVLLPVVNPNRLTLAPDRLAELGAKILITNAYIIHTTEGLRERALDEGVHDLIGFDGPIMTDSGSFQLAEYGDIDVTTEEIVQFQHAIGSDIGTPVDVPTPPDADRETAETDLAATADALADAAAVDTGEMLLNAPVQGSTYPDLRERAGRDAAETGFDVFPIGGVVPLLNNYRYAEAIIAIRGAKRGLGLDCPVHLFGAGHPMTFALAAAAGCDLFDSAAYALYARDGRYLTVAGTEHLTDLQEFPCHCRVCTEFAPSELQAADEDRRERSLAEHNLHVSFAELRRVREAIRQGRLFELVERRARGHPALLDGYRTLLEDADWLERTDPAAKATFFHVSHESAARPEVRRHQRRLQRLPVPGTLLLTEGGKPSNHDYDAVWKVKPPFGPIPEGLVETYPLTAEVPERTDEAAERAAAEGVGVLAEMAADSEITLAHDGWGTEALATLPDTVHLKNLTEVD